MIVLKIFKWVYRAVTLTVALSYLGSEWLNGNWQIALTVLFGVLFVLSLLFKGKK